MSFTFDSIHTVPANRFPAQRATAVALVLLALAAGGFAWMQNRAGYTGGEIALPKLLWLFSALWCWVVQPPLLWADARSQAPFRRLLACFMLWMLARAVVELWMMYVTHSWRPLYGILHNTGSMTLLIGGACVLRPADGELALQRRHLLALGLLFVPEIGFAHYMQTHFQTQGANPLYFVPDDERYQDVLRATWVSVLLCWAYQYRFLSVWLRHPNRKTAP
ncbi:hypothetical protein [Parachitinimonas caeni]|uniref:Uncharacterized protein n=1 Tax=Parachitinimonas caeni TaxID=3031301 RepID=A0ABT7E192_9NEIS|nr:hypothetical protein [Parachitinimonas caeni]MDK2125814.1 hypothetical protein [Parachitinimonas caeni]